MSKFKVGDKVKLLVNTLGCMAGDTGYITIDHGGNNYKGTWYRWHKSSVFVEGGCSGGVYDSEIELVTNEQPDSSENKVGKIMNNIKSFVKNSFLTADEKLLRKYGFKNDCGDYTQDAKDYAIILLCTEKEADMIKVAQGLDDEAKASK